LKAEGMDIVQITDTASYGTPKAQEDGVNPSVETVWYWHTCRSMVFPSQISSSLSG
jgi:hypothetical protein